VAEKDQQGVPLSALLGIGEMVKARVLICQHELENRTARSITLVNGSSYPHEEPGGEKLPDRRNLKTGHLVLVSFAVHPSIDELTNLLNRAVDAHCAALVLHSDQDIFFPASWIQKAEDWGMPILHLPSDVSPEELVSPLVDELIRGEHALLNRITSVQERMVEQILAGRGGQGIVDLLFTFLGTPILLVDHSGTILGQAGTWRRLPATDILLNPDQQSSTHSFPAGRSGRWYDPEDIIEVTASGQERLFARPILDGKNVLGWFILCSAPDVTDYSTRLALDQAAIAAALEIGRQTAIRQVEWRLQNDLLEDLFKSGKATGPLEDRAQRMGWDLRHKRSVMLVSWDEVEITAQSRRQLETFVHRFICAWRPESLVLPRESEILILPYLPEASDPTAAMETLQGLAQDLLKVWPHYLETISIVIAIGGVQPSSKEIVNSYREAQRALAMRRRLGLRYPVVTFQDVRIFSLLERHLDDEEAIALFQRTIGPLIEYDAKHQTEWVRTAEVYFDCNYRLQQTADQLLIHPSSLKYRLQRIRDLLGRDPFFDKDHLDYYLATKIARLF
jgi:PucR family transcriptional regulator, purine catabolism regulatory protein